MSFGEWLDIAFKVSSILALLLGSVGTCGMFIARAIFATKAELARRWQDHAKEHDALEERISAYERKQIQTDGDLRHRPARRELDELRKEIAGVAASVGAIVASTEQRDRRFTHIEAQLDRLVDFHLAGSK